MDFTYDEQQTAFRKALRTFVDKEIVPVANEWEKTGRYPTEIVDHMKAMGLFGITTPEEYGGLELDKVSFTLVYEELARGWMGIAGIVGSHNLSCWMIAKHGTDEQKQSLLPKLATGEWRTGVGLTEPGAGTDLQGIKTTAKRDGDHYVVNGAKTWITNARHANVLPVLVKTDTSATPPHKGMSLLLIDTTSEGFEVQRDMGKLGYKGTESCEISFDNVRVPVDALLGGVEGRGLQQALSGLEIGRLNIAGRSVGIAQAAYDAALQYAKERTAFGQPIAEFQAIQLKIADIATQLQAARLMTYWAASQADSGKRVDMEAGMAKYFASEAAITASLEAMRIHGGYGYSTEFVVERLYRDAPLMAIGEGTNDIMRTVIAKSLVAGSSVIG
ncbi:acyl-CoA dehydrogenase family protein [Rhodococcus sp. BP-316]|jgi:alkylation response protein AidB-like acyl-CoA dehydrogenase|uniref:acyl-CoA dehydrogenase family protein n=1 Tax=unclassified Rhodococcus (in: high G+C Gram-positive bacteria) TaxID=192944 RepID=UPI0004886C41|nr:MULTISPECIES: acyl-CoA dehydrogenase family protein [unclassified Rhodococcus (in: high G+C Gram-positive bacteria)]KIQ20068.1 acyl-CoA dehydrogenase [Rhodococcus sp. MEB064]MBY6676488.1 acyl-CoA dehydrogenase family protein [Rhodococcus sp. BP-332]MBY6682369.1 acyl-CoA dehydrogenase family protein [Rhodococcus sp. BP-316]MDQ1179242.1 alkylation response protein AidB-like acyl-CoA dehydrogenase [Rhodococcus sp. SORGH_AS_0301]